MTVAFLVKTCYCAKLPSSIVLIVPVNDSVVLNEGKFYVVVAYGLNETTLPLQFGYVISLHKTREDAVKLSTDTRRTPHSR